MRALPALTLLTACAAAPSAGDTDAAAPAPFTAVTWNTGSGGIASVADPDGWTPDIKDAADAHYGNGLAWTPAIAEATAILAALAPDVIAFQEVFDPATGCDAVPAEARAGFVCETWAPGAPSVAQAILGPGFQVACFPGKPDKCLAVRRAWGTFDGCDADRCDDALRGAEVDGCGTGSRVAAGAVRTDAGPLTVVGVHGTSGISASDIACRVAQTAAVLDGPDALAQQPGVILGDLNTDPGRQADTEASAAAWRASEAGGWTFASSLDPDAPGTYIALPIVSIDHVLVGGIDAGACTAVGLDGGSDFPGLALWDHRPIACALADPRGAPER